MGMMIAFQTAPIEHDLLRVIGFGVGGFLVIFILINLMLLIPFWIALRIQKRNARKLSDFAALYGYWPKGDPVSGLFTNGVRDVWSDRVTGEALKQPRLIGNAKTRILPQYGPVRWNNCASRDQTEHFVFSTFEAALAYGSAGKLSEEPTPRHPPKTALEGRMSGEA